MVNGDDILRGTSLCSVAWSADRAPHAVEKTIDDLSFMWRQSFDFGRRGIEDGAEEVRTQFDRLGRNADRYPSAIGGIPFSSCVSRRDESVDQCSDGGGLQSQLLTQIPRRCGNAGPLCVEEADQRADIGGVQTVGARELCGEEVQIDSESAKLVHERIGVLCHTQNYHLDLVSRSSR